MFVVDSTGYKCDWPLRTQRRDNWRFVWKQRDLPAGENGEVPSPRHTFEAHHQTLGIYVSGENGRITFVSASLPPMIHENNAVLIQSQEQLDEALANLRIIVSEIADTSTPLHYFTRVDLVWQFVHDPAALVRAHRHCVFPRCRIKKREFSERSASWDYSNKRLIMYDKSLKDRRVPGNIVRVEIQLHKKPLMQYLAGGGGSVSELKFHRCYLAFRSYLTTFAPSRQVTVPQNKYEALAISERQALAAGIDSPVELLLSTMKSRTARTWRKAITAAHLRQENFRWDNILPESGPPDAVSGY